MQDNKAPGAILQGMRPGADASHCKVCGARRIDAQLGSEPLHDCGGWMDNKEPYIEHDEDGVARIAWRYLPGGRNCGECYICRMRQVARECWRVLRDDGVMFWNIADSYASTTTGNHNGTGKSTLGLQKGLSSMIAAQRLGAIVSAENENIARNIPPGLKPKDKCGIPERTALAFQADGWYWRSGITWVKPNPMPESVTDRPTKSTEMIYLFTKSERYAWDAEAVREPHQEPWRGNGERESFTPHSGRLDDLDKQQAAFTVAVRQYNPAGRNLRDAWEIDPEGAPLTMAWKMATQAYPGAHFATFPSELPRRCIKAGTSERGCCPKCGKGWVRITETERTFESGWAKAGNPGGTGKNGAQYQGGGSTQDIRFGPVVRSTTLGWRPACTCDAGDPVPCIVLDPFSGAATTGLVARELGRHYVGLELSGEYLQQSRERLGLAALDAWAGGNGNGKAASLGDLPMFKDQS